jgi:hypothetical protein
MIADYVHIHIYIYTYIHVHIYTYTHIHMYTQVELKFKLLDRKTEEEKKQFEDDFRYLDQERQNVEQEITDSLESSVRAMTSVAEEDVQVFQQNRTNTYPHTISSFHILSLCVYVYVYVYACLTYPVTLD